jgi:hypothetical protein
MTLDEVVRQLKAERDKLNAAIEVLEASTEPRPVEVRESVCPKCGKGFATMQALGLHKYRAHPPMSAETQRKSRHVE